MSKEKAMAHHAKAGECLACDDHDGAMKHVGSMLAAIRMAKRGKMADAMAAEEAGEGEGERSAPKMSIRDRMAALRARSGK